ncbi:MAG: hypothetical protein JWM36_3061 [Hyphomicrobiales bacterium]|nr:hypothetical protein [Hyphomicrobiales bacterium]
MRTHLLSTVAAAALSISVVGAFAQEPQRRPDAGSAPGASSEAPRGAGRSEAAKPEAGKSEASKSEAGKSEASKSEAGKSEAAKPKAAETERAGSPQRASEGAEKAQPSSSAQTKTGASEGQDKTRRDSAESSKDNSKQPSAAAERAPADKGAGSAQKAGADTDKPDKSGARTTATDTSKPAGERQGTSTSSGSDRNAAERNGARDSAQGSDRQGREDAASTRTGGDAGRAASRNESSSTNIQVRGELDTDREHASRIHDRLIRESGARETDVNITVDLGGRVPDRVRLRPVPRDIVEISPRFRDYEYTVVRDEIVIVEPKTKKIVQIISGGGGRGGAGSSRHSVSLDTHQREIVKRDVMRTRTSAKRDSDVNFELREGVEVPQRVTLQSFPTEVWEEVPSLKPYRYVVIEDQIVLVDPETREVIEILR